MCASATIPLLPLSSLLFSVPLVIRRFSLSPVIPRSIGVSVSLAATNRCQLRAIGTPSHASPLSRSHSSGRSFRPSHASTADGGPPPPSHTRPSPDMPLPRLYPFLRLPVLSPPFHPPPSLSLGLPLTLLRRPAHRSPPPSSSLSLAGPVTLLPPPAAPSTHTRRSSPIRLLLSSLASVGCRWRPPSALPPMPLSSHASPLSLSLSLASCTLSSLPPVTLLHPLPRPPSTPPPPTRSPTPSPFFVPLSGPSSNSLSSSSSIERLHKNKLARHCSSIIDTINDRKLHVSSVASPMPSDSVLCLQFILKFSIYNDNLTEVFVLLKF